MVADIASQIRDRHEARVPRKLQTQKLAVQRAVETLNQTLSRPPTIQEIAEATGFTQEEIFDTFELGKYGKPLSLEAEYYGNSIRDVSTLLDYLGSEDPRFDNLCDRIDLTDALG